MNFNIGLNYKSMESNLSKTLLLFSNSLQNDKIFKINDLNDILSSDYERIINFLRSCSEPKVWLYVIVRILIKVLFL